MQVMEVNVKTSYVLIAAVFFVATTQFPVVFILADYFARAGVGSKFVKGPSRLPFFAAVMMVLVGGVSVLAVYLVDLVGHVYSWPMPVPRKAALIALLVGWLIGVGLVRGPVQRYIERD